MYNDFLFRERKKKTEKNKITFSEQVAATMCRNIVRDERNNISVTQSWIKLRTKIGFIGHGSLHTLSTYRPQYNTVITNREVERANEF